MSDLPPPPPPGLPPGCTAPPPYCQRVSDVAHPASQPSSHDPCAGGGSAAERMRWRHFLTAAAAARWRPCAGSVPLELMCTSLMRLDAFLACSLALPCIGQMLTAHINSLRRRAAVKWAAGGAGCTQAKEGVASKLAHKEAEQIGGNKSIIKRGISHKPGEQALSGTCPLR